MNMIDAVCNCLSAVTVLDQFLHCNQQILFLIITNVLHIICHVCAPIRVTYPRCMMLCACSHVSPCVGRGWVLGQG